MSVFEAAVVEVSSARAEEFAEVINRGLPMSAFEAAVVAVFSARVEELAEVCGASATEEIVKAVIRIHDECNQDKKLKRDEVTAGVQARRKWVKSLGARRGGEVGQELMSCQRKPAIASIGSPPLQYQIQEAGNCYCLAAVA